MHWKIGIARWVCAVLAALIAQSVMPASRAAAAEDIPAICQATPRGAATARSAVESEPIRAVRVHYASLSRSRGQVADLQRRLSAVRANFVTLSAGRPDWAYFKWAGQHRWWSSEVTRSGVDYLAADIAAYGRGRHVDVVVDVFAPAWLRAHPQDAAVDAQGRRSTLQASLYALTEGQFGRHVLAMIGYLARHYPLHSISITELFYDDYGFGEDDLALWQRDTGYADWPRYPDGRIARDHPGLGAWRSRRVASWLQRAAACAHNHGKQLYFDARISWANPANDALESGQHYATLLPIVDRIILWGYPNLNGYAPDYLREVAAVITSRYPGNRFIMSVGLWDREGAITPEELQTAMLSSQDGGLSDLFITPSSMLTDDHWAILARSW